MLKLVSSQTDDQLWDRGNEIEEDMRFIEKNLVPQFEDGWYALDFLKNKTEKQLKRVRKYKLTVQQINDLLKLKELEKKFFQLKFEHHESIAELSIIYSKELTMEEILRERLKRPNYFKENLKKHRNTKMPRNQGRW